jgi:MFS family permease
MAVIAFINQNMAMACFWGSFSVLLGAVSARLGVGRELSTMAVPVLILSTAFFAPIVGVAAARCSLRLIMLAGALLNVIGFLLLAVTSTYSLYLLIIGVVLGPAMASGIILPSTLVTRWFVVNRAKVLAVVTAPIILAAIPLSATWVLKSYGLPAVYFALSSFSIIAVYANLFIEEAPNRSCPNVAVDAQEHTGDTSTIGVLSFFRSPCFWSLTFAFTSTITGSFILSIHMVQMAKSWGMSATLGASLLSIGLLTSFAGTLLFSWIADRFGGFVAIVILVLTTGTLWMMLLLHLSVMAIAVVVGLIGASSAGGTPAISLALSEAFGEENFSRAYGLVNLISMPFSAFCVPVVTYIFIRTNSYNGALAGLATLMILSGLATLWSESRAN